MEARRKLTWVCITHFSIGLILMLIGVGIVLGATDSTWYRLTGSINYSGGSILRICGKNKFKRINHGAEISAIYLVIMCKYYNRLCCFRYYPYDVWNSHPLLVLVSILCCRYSESCIPAYKLCHVVLLWPTGFWLHWKLSRRTYDAWEYWSEGLVGRKNEEAPEEPK